MKTKMVFAALLMLIGVAQVRAGGDKPTLKISHHDGSGIFLVNYRGTDAADLKVTIKDVTGTVLFTESIKGVKGFSLPVNLESAGAGVYTLEVGNKTIRQVETLEYIDHAPESYTHVTHIGDNRYMLSVAHAGTEKMMIRILNDAGDAVYEKEELIEGNFAIVYKLTNRIVTPSFEVTDHSGASVVVR